MQRTVDHCVIISCDFTGTDWDQEAPMIEGHQGSVISLEALAMAIEQAAPVSKMLKCTMCLRDIDVPDKAWSHPDPPTTANPNAVICWDCIQQADRAFSKDPDSGWTRRVPSNERWT